MKLETPHELGFLEVEPADDFGEPENLIQSRAVGGRLIDSRVGGPKRLARPLQVTAQQRLQRGNTIRERTVGE